MGPLSGDSAIGIILREGVSDKAKGKLLLLVVFRAVLTWAGRCLTSPRHKTKAPGSVLQSVCRPALASD